MRKRNPIGKRKTTCSNCGIEVEESRKGQRYCKTCHAENMRKTRPKHSELTVIQRKKHNARAYLREYIKRGKIVRKPCEVCGELKSEPHHADYDKPLEVIWLCRKHHLELHKKENNEAKKI
jgi:hypothetical protein